MGILRIYRNGYQDNNYVYRIMQTINEDAQPVIERWYLGVTGCSPKEVEEGFGHIHRASGKNVYVKAHCFSLDFEDMTNEYEVRQTVTDILDIISSRFQIIAVLYINSIGSYECIFLINSISYNDYSNFHSNNNTYSELLTLLRRVTCMDWNQDAAESVYFKNDGTDIERYRNL